MSGTQPEGNEVPPADQDPFIVPPEQVAVSPKPAFHATRTQRIALIIGLLVTFWLALQLFASVLAPFVAAAVLCYALERLTTYLTRFGVPRVAAALLMMIGAISFVLLFGLELYPLVILQIGLLNIRIPQYP